jgi:hypothetical protein
MRTFCELTLQMNPSRCQRGLSDRHRQAVADLVHLCSNTGPEIAITRATIQCSVASGSS